MANEKIVAFHRNIGRKLFNEKKFAIEMSSIQRWNMEFK
jgi:hypothetical protein